MSSYTIYELKCPKCKSHYTQMISELEEDLSVQCPSCETSLEKVRKLTGRELLSCVYSYGGG